MNKLLRFGAGLTLAAAAATALADVAGLGL